MAQARIPAPGLSPPGLEYSAAAVVGWLSSTTGTTVASVVLVNMLIKKEKKKRTNKQTHRGLAIHSHCPGSRILLYTRWPVSGLRTF